MFGGQELPARYAWPADIWAMGVILYELCALKLPFDGGIIYRVDSVHSELSACTYVCVLENELLEVRSWCDWILIFGWHFNKFTASLTSNLTGLTRCRSSLAGSSMVILVQSIIRGAAPPLPEDGDRLRALLGFVLLWHICVSPKIGVPQNGWFIMENPIKMDALGVPPFSETSIWFVVYLHMSSQSKLFRFANPIHQSRSTDNVLRSGYFFTLFVSWIFTKWCLLWSLQMPVAPGILYICSLAL